MDETDPEGRRALAPWQRWGLLAVAAIALYGAGLGTGWLLATGNGQNVPATARPVAPLLWQAWNIIEAHYVNTAALQPKRMIYGAISGMLSALGDTDHTRFLTPAEVQQEDAQLSGHFVGIGVTIDTKSGRPIIVAPLPNSPAQKEGLQAGDVILAVNGKDTAQLSISELSATIRGPAGSTVDLLILRPATQRTFSVRLTRAVIVVPAVEAHRFTVNGKVLEQIHITQYSADVDAQLRPILRRAGEQHVTGIILDLRDNPGGLLNQAVDVTSEFLRQGNVLLEEGRNGVQHPNPVKSGGLATETPLAVLINEGTASAAEITAGALKDYHRGPVIGVTTFGTGTVLSDYSLQDGSKLLLGTEEWLTPDGQLIWHHGITPTEQVTLPANVQPLFPDAEGTASGSELRQGPDRQLARAIEDLAR